MNLKVLHQHPVLLISGYHADCAAPMSATFLPEAWPMTGRQRRHYRRPGQRFLDGHTGNDEFAATGFLTGKNALILQKFGDESVRV